MSWAPAARALCLRSEPGADARPPQWQAPVLMKLETPVDVNGNPWPLDAQGKPIINAA